MRDEVNNIVRSIDETTDRDISLIEEREKNLKSLLDETGRRLKVYIREMENHQAPRIIDTAPVPKVRNIPEKTADTPDSPPVLPPQQSSAESGEKQSPAFPIPSFTVKPLNSSASTVADQISQLERAGFSAPVIASRLGLSIAEVEFALALLERRDNQ